MSTQTLKKKVRVVNELGLHTRPATLIVKLLQDCKSTVTFKHKKETIDARSILNILMLAAQKNALITITVTGVDAQETMDRLVESFESRFGEDFNK
ncbi:MAG: HPr family phosphocarrier protein [Chlamydiales bacterium]|nr:HPr family phosphocarrier protein [Chlamydiales bacterium]